MERVPRQKYTKEFREQAVQLVQDQALDLLHNLSLRIPFQPWM